MRSLTAILFLTLSAGTVIALAQSQLEFSCSTFPKNADEASLVARFGSANVKSAPVFAFDDGPQDGTVLFADQADAKVEIIWNDPKSKSSPAWIRVQGERSRWRPPVGLTLGASLLAIEQANGKPFRLLGFGTEGSGRVVSWSGGRLTMADGATCKINLYVQPRWDGTDDSGSMSQVGSAKEFSSGHPAMQKLNPKLSVITISYSN
jgi:hypothetical protein